MSLPLQIKCSAKMKHSSLAFVALCDTRAFKSFWYYRTNNVIGSETSEFPMT